jgi:hypothetical protein
VPVLTAALYTVLVLPGSIGQAIRRRYRRLADGLAGQLGAARAAYADRREARETARARAELRLDPEMARKLLATIEEPAPFPGVAPNTTTVFDKQKCPHCLGLHSRKCPAVAEVEYHPDGRVQRVTYFRHGEWPEDQVLWREDIEEAAAFKEAA